MEVARKRLRDVDTEAAAETAARDIDEAAASVHQRATPQPPCVRSTGVVQTRRTAQEEERQEECDYADLEQRSATLLARLGRRRACDAGHCAALGGTQIELSQPLTLPCTLESHAAELRWAIRPVWPPSESLSDAAGCRASAGACQRRAKSTQTDASTSLEAQRRQLATELGELYTLLHVFFA